jgi:chemotaxis protein MotB
MKKNVIIASILVMFLQGCVSKKKFNEQVKLLDAETKAHTFTQMELDRCKLENEGKQKNIQALEEEIVSLKANSNALINQMSNLSVISKEQAESIKKSIENLNSKDAYIKNLQTEMARKDSLNMALVMNIKKALIDVNDEDIQVSVEGSAVFVSISDKLLFKSGSYEVSTNAKDVLGKVARVLNMHAGLQFMVEGHTDNKPIRGGFVKDNWDLSVLRATSVSRILQTDYKISPNRIIAAGRSEYVPVSSNTTDQGRALNRRTRIVILPQLDQFFKLLEN